MWQCFLLLLFLCAQGVPLACCLCPVLYYCLTSLWPAGLLAVLMPVILFHHSVFVWFCSKASAAVSFLCLFLFSISSKCSFHLLLICSLLPVLLLFCFYTGLYEVLSVFYLFLPLCMLVLGFSPQIPVLLQLIASWYHAFFFPTCCVCPFPFLCIFCSLCSRW
jgi:hypothetical protein